MMCRLITAAVHEELCMQHVRSALAVMEIQAVTPAVGTDHGSVLTCMFVHECCQGAPLVLWRLPSTAGVHSELHVPCYMSALLQ